MKKQLILSILTSYLIGTPIGIFAIAATLVMPLLFTGEGLFTLVFFSTYGMATVGLVLAFLIALGIGGASAYRNINNGTSLLLTSFKYSALVNLIIWTTFCLILWLTIGDGSLLMMILPIFAFVVCTLLTTGSIGLLIVYIIKQINKKPTAPKT